MLFRSRSGVGVGVESIFSHKSLSWNRSRLRFVDSKSLVIRFSSIRGTSSAPSIWKPAGPSVLLRCSRKKLIAGRSDVAGRPGAHTRPTYSAQPRVARRDPAFQTPVTDLLTTSSTRWNYIENSGSISVRRSPDRFFVPLGCGNICPVLFNQLYQFLQTFFFSELSKCDKSAEVGATVDVCMPLFHRFRRQFNRSNSDTDH